MNNITSSFFKTSTGREIFYEFQSAGPASPVVFLNGLSDSFDEWKKVTGLTTLNRSMLFVDLIGQGRALEKELCSGKKFDYRVSLEDQVQCLIELLDHLGLDQFSLAGFSYGGGIALGLAQMIPERIENLILFLPFLLRLDLAFPLSRALHFQYDLLKKMTPSFLHTPYQLIEKSYGRFVHDYMHFRFAGRIPSEIHREIAIQISEGIMGFNVFDILRDLPDNRVHLISADLDTLIPKSLMREFWERLPQVKKASWTRVTDGEHLLFDQNPAFCAHLLEAKLNWRPENGVAERKLSTQDDIFRPGVFSA